MEKRQWFQGPNVLAVKSLLYCFYVLRLQRDKRALFTLCFYARQNETLPSIQCLVTLHIILYIYMACLLTSCWSLSTNYYSKVGVGNSDKGSVCVNGSAGSLGGSSMGRGDGRGGGYMDIVAQCC